MRQALHRIHEENCQAPKGQSNPSRPGGGVTSKAPLAFLYRMVPTTSLEAKPLEFSYARLLLLLRTLQVPNLYNYDALTNVANLFTSLMVRGRLSYFYS